MTDDPRDTSEADEPPAGQDAVEETAATEPKKPARRRRSRAKAKPDATEEAGTEPTGEAGDADEPAGEAAAELAAEAEPAAESDVGDAEDAEEAPAKPRRRRRRTPDAEPEADAAGPSDGDDDSESPARPARSRRTPADGAPPVVRAHARYVRTSARKARLVCDHIRGKSVEEARAVLTFTPRAVARDWSKLLESAIANAENNHELVGDDLRVKEAYADEGPTLKRYRPRAMGRATRIRKRTSHLTITLTPKE